MSWCASPANASLVNWGGPLIALSEPARECAVALYSTPTLGFGPRRFGRGSRPHEGSETVENTAEGIVTLASFTCQWRDALMGRTQRNQWLAEFESGTGHLENPLFLADVTMPS